MSRRLAPFSYGVALAALVAIACGASSPSVDAPHEVPRPPVDSDDDGIPDGVDLCPNDPEDCDGFEDDDGCPDLDNDKDQIPDACDKCPDEPETFNGTEDDDGCPDSARVIVVDASMQIIEIIRFGKDSAVETADSRVMIQQVAASMRDRPEIERVGVTGYAQAVEHGAVALSEKRARHIVDLMVKDGINPARLEARGAGDTLASYASSPTDERQRSVTFRVERARGEDRWRWERSSSSYVPATSPPIPAAPPVARRECSRTPIAAGPGGCARPRKPRK